MSSLRMPMLPRPRELASPEWRWRVVDGIGHFLYEPTALGSRCRVARWHHRLHLIPAALLERLCGRYDRTLGVYDD